MIDSVPFLDFILIMLVQGRRSCVWGRLVAQNRLFSSLRETLKLNVGGQKYTLFREDIRKHPDSYFATAIQKDTKDNENFIPIDRNGVLFKYVSAFLVSGRLPRASLDRETLELLKREAEFFKLNPMLVECDRGILSAGQAQAGLAVKEVVVAAVDFSAPVVNVLRQMWRPLLIQGVLQSYQRNGDLFKGNSLNEPNVDVLIAAAKRMQPNNSGHSKIDAFFLSQSTLATIEEIIDVSSLFPEQQVKLKARELLIRTPDSKECSAGDNVEPRVGTVEVILNSAFTGGELQVMCDGQTTTVKTDPCSWVAVHTDASCSVNPVTSGARVSLIYDVIALTERSQSPVYVKGELKARYGDEILDGVKTEAFHMDRLVEIAQRLQPQPQPQQPAHSSILRLDPYFLNEKTLEKLANLTEVTKMFPGKTLDFRPVDVMIQSKGLDTYTYERKDTGEGYLGTLVMVLGSYFADGDVRLSRALEPPTVITGTRMSWYAYDANTTLQLCPITYGTRVAVHYDIYSTGNVDTVHDPFVRNDLTTLSHTTVPATLREQVLAAVNAELLNTDNVIITLQDTYPDSVRTEDLNGGDRALCDVLRHSVDASGWNEVELVKVSLRFQYDIDLWKNVLHSSTYTTQTWGSNSDANCTKLIIPTFLPEKPGVWRGETKKIVHHVTAIRVSKRK